MRKNYIALVSLFLFVLLSGVNASAQVVAVWDYAYFTSIPTAQTVIPNVLANDFVNDIPATLSNVNLTSISASPGVQLLADGSIYADAGILGGYVQYEICDIANPNNCSTEYALISTFESSNGPATDLTVLVPPTCAHPFSTIQFSNFPNGTSTLPGNLSWLVNVVVNGVPFAEVYTIAGEPVILENVPPGELFFGLSDFDFAMTAGTGGLYIPEPDCDISLTFNGLVADTNGSGLQDVGDTINFQFSVTNVGTVPLTNVTITSPTLAITGGPIPSLGAGIADTTTFSAAYQLTQDDISTGFINFSATVTGFDGADLKYDSFSEVTTMHIPDGFRAFAFNDVNNNGVQDQSDFGVSQDAGQLKYEVNNDGIEHNISTSYGSAITFYENNPLTAYHLTCTINPEYALMYTPAVSTMDITVPAGSGITIHKFPVTRLPFKDLRIDIIGSYGARPGHNSAVKIKFRNYGDTTVNSGTIVYTKDPNVTLTGFSVPVTVTPTGFTYSFSNLAAGEFRYIDFIIQVPPIPAVNDGDVLHSTAVISTPEPELYTNNNIADNQVHVWNAWDPNNKSESHGPQILRSAFSSDDYLKYTIHFENTGSVDAIDIKLTDILDAALDENTVRMIDASHNYVLDRVGNNLTWRFDGIHLDPSVDDSNTGKGYLMFEVKPKLGYAVGDIIPNHADIFFDTNPSIATNTFETEFVNTLNVNGFADTGFIAYPNPTASIFNIVSKDASTIDSVDVIDVLGKIVLSKTNNDFKAAINLSYLSKGIYFVKVKSANSEKTIKLIKS